jgi:uncharacterized membrane protein YoaK (UPF0700 family)
MLTCRRDIDLACALSALAGALLKAGQLIAAALTGNRWDWMPNLLLWAALVAGSVRGALAYHWPGLAAIWFAAGAAFALSAILTQSGRT